MPFKISLNPSISHWWHLPIQAYVHCLSLSSLWSRPNQDHCDKNQIIFDVDDDWDEEGWAWDSLAWWDSQCTTAELGQPDHKKAKTNKSRKASTTQAADASIGEHTKEEDKVKW